jgi:hypothetical protein
VARASLVEPAGRLLVDFLLKHPAFDGLGVGKAKAARLWTEFVSDLHVVLSTADVGKLSDVLPEDSAQKLMEAWRSVTEELLDNPYRMLAFADWEKAVYGGVSVSDVVSAGEMALPINPQKRLIRFIRIIPLFNPSSLRLNGCRTQLNGETKSPSITVTDNLKG